VRILHVLAEVGYSGGEVQLHHLLEHLVRSGHENTILLPPRARFAAACVTLGVPVLEAPLRQPWSPSMWRGVRRAVRGLAPDVLHFGCGRSLLWAGLAARSIAVPLRVTTRRIDYPISRSVMQGGRYRSLVDHVIANCEAVRKRVLAAGVPADRVWLVHEGIDLSPWLGLTGGRAAARERLRIPREALVVCCAATLRPRKGQAALVDALAALAPRWPHARLILAGAGTEGERLRRRAARLAVLDRVSLPGAVADLRDHYAAADVFALASRHEGLANACLEASAAGLPLVVTAAGGLPEIVADGVTGTVVPIGDVGRLAAALERYFADPDLRARAGAAGAERTRALFSAARMASATEALWQRLLAERTGDAGRGITARPPPS
jgi:glycosyltransferase involved in cell wall biosynthesis